MSLYLVLLSTKIVCTSFPRLATLPPCSCLQLLVPWSWLSQRFLGGASRPFPRSPCRPCLPPQSTYYVNHPAPDSHYYSMTKIRACSFFVPPPFFFPTPRTSSLIFAHFIIDIPGFKHHFLSSLLRILSASTYMGLGWVLLFDIVWNQYIPCLPTS